MTPKLKKMLTEMIAMIILSLFALGLAMLVGCSSTKAVQSTIVADTTSVKIVHHIEKVRDTVYVEIPQVIERNVTRDTVSHLENEYAKSDAIIDGEYLWHTLEMKPQEKAVEIFKEIEYRDTIIEKATIVEVEKPIDKPDTWWEQTQKKGFWTMLIIFAILVLWHRLKDKISILK